MEAEIGLKSGWLSWLFTSHYRISMHSLYFNFQIQLENILNPGREVHYAWSIHIQKIFILINLD